MNYQHGEKHSDMQADMVLECELRSLHLDSQVVEADCVQISTELV